jgi:hypothetical protein
VVRVETGGGGGGAAAAPLRTRAQLSHCDVTDEKKQMHMVKIASFSHTQ